jgi:ectoine hydroxylase-related dioxygenase (phytanoyl-CoA dioxygenase family)
MNAPSDFAHKLASYRRFGFAAPMRVLSVEAANRYRAACDELEVLLGGNPRTVEVRQMHLHFRWAYELAVEPLVLDCVEQVLGKDILVWATELFSKRPGDPNLYIAWHRDRPYMGFDPALTTTCWISLGRSYRENGCLQVVLEADRERSTLGNGRKGEPGPGVPESQVTDVVLEPGEMSMHDITVYHGSGPNLSRDKRIGFAVRYISPRARALSGRPRVVLARGQDSGENFELATPPDEADTKVALAEMRQSALSHLDAMLYNLKQLR